MTTATIDTKPLNSVERRTLEKLVKNDYETLSAELHVIYEKACIEAGARHKATIEKSAAGRDAKAMKVRAALAKIEQKANADVDRVIAAAEREGYSLNLTGGRDRYGDPGAYRGFKVSLAEIEDAKADKTLKDELASLSRQYNAAKSQLRRQELTVQRELLLTALTSDAAKEFLNQIPSARDLFVNAAIEA